MTKLPQKFNFIQGYVNPESDIDHIKAVVNSVIDYLQERDESRRKEVCTDCYVLHKPNMHDLVEQIEKPTVCNNIDDQLDVPSCTPCKEPKKFNIRMLLDIYAYHWSSYGVTGNAVEHKDRMNRILQVLEEAIKHSLGTVSTTVLP